MTPDEIKQHQDKQLWAAVILQALEDATATISMADAHERRAAREWFKDAGKDFHEVCALAGMDHDAVRTAALQKIEEFDQHGKQRGRVVTFKGEKLTLKELSERTGVPVDTIRSRLSKGVRGDALGAPQRKTQTITFNGETRTVNEWARISGVSTATIGRRLREGLSAEEALTPGRQRRKPTQAQRLMFRSKLNPTNQQRAPCKISLKRRYAYAGQSKTLSQWATDRGINVHTLKTRLAQGWSIDRALTTPVKGKTSKQSERLAA
ncbi:hypothetical protein AMST5_01446 [freshwater sediment metagenome]|uniref:Uncharacterized protein n=1 Tax=freshwater sediment metagenome TaxID=556182 RepID=A0AA48M0Y6_9ZZZZ